MPSRGRSGWRLGREAVLCGAGLFAMLCATAPAAHAAADAGAASAELSNQAFALLNSLNATDADGNANPEAKELVGPVASFAGDAQTLSQALKAKDNAGARRAAASLDADAASVDAGLKAHKAAISADRWAALKHQLAAIEKSVPPAPASDAPASDAPAPVAPVDSGEPAGAAAPASGDSALPAAAPDSAAAASAPAPPDNGGPTIKIESRSVIGSVTHLKGYFEGSALRSAGIYEGAQNVKPLKVDHVVGRQKVDFQLSIRDADIATNLRVIDQAGRSATASVFGEDSTALASTGRESGVEVDRGAGATSGNNTAEIPSESAPDAADAGPSGLDESAPSTDEGGIGSGSIGGLGGGLGAPMGNIQINIESINPVNPLSHLYQVVGQIIGKVRRAGIYVDGRLVKRIPVSHGSLSNFSTTFSLNGGTATIRAFGAGNQYVESSIAMPPAVASAPPIVVAPYGMNPYSPFGMNPYPMDPYGSPYGSPFGTPYGTPYGSSPSYGINISPFGITRYPVSPYGASPYGASPYGAAPYGVNPYAAPINPYGNARPMGPAGR
ncbi:MAG TPA: hypothetical protein VKT12_08800 [Candidatus Binataceae bacterium]|nr:hypothetical protein [Candidatus Binataceae bacterium]